LHTASGDEELDEVEEEEDNNYLVTLNPASEAGTHLGNKNGTNSIQTASIPPTLMNKENGTLSSNTIGFYNSQRPKTSMSRKEPEIAEAIIEKKVIRHDLL
jgi:hypothetical protein